MIPVPIQLLIADDSLETCDILENYFSLTQQINVCGIAHDGDEALFRIAQCQPDVLLLDLIMPKVDGLAVLERLGRIPLPKHPKVIVTSAVGQESFTSTALILGADYYMIKPYDLSDLYSRICTVAAVEAKKALQTSIFPKGNDLELQVSRSLLELGLPPHMLGYRYSSTAVLLLLSEDRPQSIVKDVYARVAKKFATTPECVEGAIRKAIRRAWDAKREEIRLLTGNAKETPPSNGRFLTNLAQHVRLDSENGDDSFAI